MALLQCLSHTPLMDLNPIPQDIRNELDVMLESARVAIHAYNPDVCVIFFPDHYNTFSYRLMPQICIGVKAQTIGDYGTKIFNLNVPEKLALNGVEALMEAGFDPALSYDMQVDHAVAQPLSILFDNPSAIPVIPIFINAAAEPLAPFGRSWDLGVAFGQYLNSLGKRVLIMGSGGLSHDPPIPRMHNASEQQRQRLIIGNLGMPSDNEMARQAQVSQFGRDFAEKGGKEIGIHDLNPDWDNQFMDMMTRGDEAAVKALANYEIKQAAGGAAHEVRVWSAAFGALSSFGPYTVLDRFYRPIPEWIAGFAMMRAQST